MPVSQGRQKKQAPKGLSKEIAIGGITLTQKAAFAKHMAVMLSSGLLINEALEIVEDSSKGKMKKVIRGIRKSVEAGNSLSDAFAQYPRVFSSLVVDVTRAGEASGTLAQNLENIAVQLDKEKKLIGKIKSALAYPMVIMVAAFGLAIALSLYVLPQIIPLFTGLDVELPLTTRIVIAFSTLMQDHGFLIVGLLIATIMGLIWISRQRFSHPVTHWIALHIPVLKQLAHNSNLARFSLTLGTLIKSGLTISEALAITEGTVSNYYFRRAVKRARARVEKGTSIADNLHRDRHLFPKLVTSMVHVGESSGRLDETLLYLASFYEEEVDNATKTLTTALEPMLLIVIGIVVGTLALSIITPIYEITGNIRR